MHWLLKIRDGLLRRDSDTELKGSPAVAAAAATNVAVVAVAAAAAARAAAEERVSVRSLGAVAAELYAVNFLEEFCPFSVGAYILLGMFAKQT